MKEIDVIDEFNNLSEKEKLALYGVAELIFTNMQKPPEGGYPSPKNTKKWIINGLIAIYLSGKAGDVGKIMSQFKPSNN